MEQKNAALLLVYAAVFAGLAAALWGGFSLL